MQHLDEGTIHAWLDGELPPAEREAAEAHVATCDECKAAVAEARGFIAGASRILLALDAVPGGVLPASSSTVSAKARAPKRFTISRAWMAAAAVLVLSTATVIAIQPKREPAIATVAARDELGKARADAPSAQSAGASAPTVAMAPEPSPAPSEKMAEKKEPLRRKAESQPMIVAEAPFVAKSAPASPRAHEPSAASSARAADAMVAQAPAPAPTPAPVNAPAPEVSRLRAMASVDSSSTALNDVAKENISISGLVVSEAGAPLGTASVTLEGTGLVTLTHDDGRYALTVPAARVDGKTRSLVARLIGYKAASAPIVAAGDSVSQDFVMRTNPLMLSEIVVTGVGTNQSVEKLGNSVEAADSAKDAGASGNIRIRGSRAYSGAQKSGFALSKGVFATLLTKTSSAESGEPVEISVYRVRDTDITFIDRLKPDTSRRTIDEPLVAQLDRDNDKQKAKVNSLAWTDAKGRIRSLRGAVSLDVLRRLERALDNATP